MPRRPRLRHETPFGPEVLLERARRWSAAHVPSNGAPDVNVGVLTAMPRHPPLGPGRALPCTPGRSSGWCGVARARGGHEGAA